MRSSGTVLRCYLCWRRELHVEERVEVALERKINVWHDEVRILIMSFVCLWRPVSVVFSHSSEGREHTNASCVLSVAMVVVVSVAKGGQGG